MSRFVQIREAFLDAGCREEAFDALLTDHIWYTLEYLVTLADVLLEAVPPAMRLTVEEQVNQLILANRDLMKAQRTRAVGA